MAAAKAAYDSSAKRLGAAAQAALQAAYIDRMRAQRDMPQQLATMGINGGMSETAAARLMALAEVGAFTEGVVAHEAAP